MLVLWWAETFQSIKHVDVCRIHGETNVIWWHGSRQSHCDDRAHNITWIYTYGNRLEHILVLQGQELSWLERVTHVATRVHHTKYTITHTHASIYICIYIYIHIHTSCTMLSHKARKVNQTLPTFQGYGPTRYRKCKIDITIPRERGTSKEQENKRGYMDGDPNTCSKEEA